MPELALPSSGDPKLLELRKSLDECELDQLENVWIDLVDGDGLSPERIVALLDTAHGLVRMGFPSRAGPLLELLAPAAETVEGVSPQVLLRIRELLVRAQPRNRESLAAFVERFHEVHGPESPERAYFTAAGVAEAADPLRALERYARLMRFQPGAVVYHRSGWGIGEVLAVDAFLGQVKVDLEHKKNHRIAIDAVDSILEVLPESSFRALLYRGGDELRRLAAEDPAALVEKLLEDFGSPLPQKEVKARLVPEVVEAAAWARWWGQAKSAMRETGYFRVGDRSPYLVEKLERELSFEEDLLARFEREDWAEARLAARQVLRGGPRKFVAAFPKVRDALVARGRVETDPERAFEIATLLSRYGGFLDGGVYLKEVLGRFSSRAAADALAALPPGEDLAQVFRCVKEARPGDWIEIAVTSFTGKSDAVRGAACELLEAEAPDLARSLAAEILASPRRAPEAYCWLVERRMRGESLVSLEPIAGRSPRGVFLLLTDLLEHVADKEVREGRAAVKDLYRRLEGLLYFGEGQFFRQAVLEMDAAQRLEVHQTLVRHQGIILQVATRLLEILATLEPVIGRRAEAAPWLDERVIYTTEEGQKARRAELRELREVKLPAIFKAIGDAAAFGDLSENAEFTSALEERDKLVRRAEEAQSDLDRSRLIEPASVKRGEIGLGSRIRVRDLDSGAELTYSVLGPWDGSPEDGVLSYRSPLGRAFLGKKEGDEVLVELPGRTARYRVLESRSHFD